MGWPAALPSTCLVHSWPSSQSLVFQGTGPPAPIHLAPSSTNRLPNLQACLGYSKQLHYSKRLKGSTGGRGGKREGGRTEREREQYRGLFFSSLFFLVKKSIPVLQAKHFKRLIPAPLQNWIYHHVQFC